jgi:hypothetical protein
MTIWRMGIACWIPKATNTHSQYVIIIALPQQKWFQERTSMSLYTCIGCLIYVLNLMCGTDQACKNPVPSNLYAASNIPYFCLQHINSLYVPSFT